jgi:hypothetical protein
MSSSDRKRYETRQRLVLESVEAVLSDNDADLSNLTDALVADSPQAAAFAYAKLTASVIDALALATGRPALDVLADIRRGQLPDPPERT